jgi:hypothetical protein
MDCVNDILATAASGEEVEVARKVAGATARFDVPDFDVAMEMYQRGEGSAEDHCLARGKYRSIWNREKLAKVLSMAGWEITGGIDGTSWRSPDGWLRVVANRVQKPNPRLPMSEVQAIMSMPRIAWTDTMGATHLACVKLGIDFLKGVGVFWGQCLQRMMEQVCADPSRKYVLTIDYDSIFDPEDIVRLWQIMETNPDVDALFPLQVGRDRDTCLLSMVNEDGERIKRVDAAEFRRQVLPCETGHFGLTLIRTDALRRMKKPWFVPTPAPDGGWGDGRVDDDIHFWHAFRAAGNNVCVTPRVRIGHLQLIVTWPGEDLRTIHQYCSKYGDEGRPTECMNF